MKTELQNTFKKFLEKGTGRNHYNYKGIEFYSTNHDRALDIERDINDFFQIGIGNIEVKHYKSLGIILKLREEYLETLSLENFIKEVNRVLDNDVQADIQNVFKSERYEEVQNQSSFSEGYMKAMQDIFNHSEFSNLGEIRK